MRNFIELVEKNLLEGEALRKTNPEVIKWIEQAVARPDANELYIHGSDKIFDHFNQPNLDYGHLIFSSKLKNNNRSSGQAYQAEYYGRNLYLLKLYFNKRFDPQNDPVARNILIEALECEYEQKWSDDGETRIYRGVWDFDQKIKQGRIDYQDCHRVIPLAVKSGYDFFQIYEVSMRGFSYGSAYSSKVDIIDRYPA